MLNILNYLAFANRENRETCARPLLEVSMDLIPTRRRLDASESAWFQDGWRSDQDQQGFVWPNPFFSRDDKSHGTTNRKALSDTRDEFQSCSD